MVGSPHHCTAACKDLCTGTHTRLAMTTLALTNNLTQTEDDWRPPTRQRSDPSAAHRAANANAPRNAAPLDRHMSAWSGQRTRLKAHAPFTVRRTSSSALAARAAVRGGPTSVPRGGHVGRGLRHRVKRTLHPMGSPRTRQQQAHPAAFLRTIETGRSSSAGARARHHARAWPQLVQVARQALPSA